MKHRISPATVIACVALFFSLGGIASAAADRTAPLSYMQARAAIRAAWTRHYRSVRVGRCFRVSRVRVGCHLRVRLIAMIGRSSSAAWLSAINYVVLRGDRLRVVMGSGTVGVPLATPNVVGAEKRVSGDALCSGPRACSALSAYAQAHPAPTQTVTIIDKAEIPGWYVRILKRALVWQADELRASWHTPEVRFAPGGWPLVLLPPSPLPCGTQCDAFHAFDGSPYAEVAAEPGDWTVLASHELMEMLVDPRVDGPEVCDPVEGDVLTYVVGTRWVVLADFVGPAYFDAGASTSGTAAGPRRERL